MTRLAWIIGLASALSCMAFGLTKSASAQPTAQVRERMPLYPSDVADKASGELLPEGRVEVVERRGDWVRVRLEGWVLDSKRTLDGDRPVANPSEFASPNDESRGRARVEGILQLKSRRLRRADVEGTRITILSAKAEITDTDPATESVRLVELDREIDAANREATRAIQQDNFSKAAADHDAAKARRRRLLEERRTILAARHGRHASRVQALAIAQTTCDSRGWFALTGLPAGDWQLHARFSNPDEDFEWLVPLRLDDEETARIDLDETRSTGNLESAGMPR